MTAPKEPVPLVPELPREMRVVVVSVTETVSAEPCLVGKCHVVDGDTIVIRGRHIRLAGIDAPEMDHPFGVQAKWALVNLCKGQVVTAHLKPELSHDRVVAQCFLPDGRDLAAEMVSMGLAIDWPKYSGGRYSHLEPTGVRKKLFRAAMRQRGMAGLLDDLTPVERASVSTKLVAQSPAVRSSFSARPKPSWSFRAGRSVRRAFRPVTPRMGWIVIPAVLVVLVSVAQIRTESPPAAPRSLATVPRQSPAPMVLEVTAATLNVRASPSGNADVIAQVQRGTLIVPNQVSGRWYAILLQDGRTGWLYGEYLASVER